jgi:hypothetical protein
MRAAAQYDRTHKSRYSSIRPSSVKVEARPGQASAADG